MIMTFFMYKYTSRELTVCSKDKTQSKIFCGSIEEL
jgi:hypothetical protein